MATIATVLADSQKHLQSALDGLKSAADAKAQTHHESTSTAPLKTVLAAYAANDPSRQSRDAWT